MNSIHPPILKLDVSGMPVDWINWQTAAALYSRKVVKWEAGDTRFEVIGGFNAADGSRSTMSMSSIIAVQDRRWRHSAALDRIPLTRAAVYARDRMTCLYCGFKFTAGELSLDHVVPVARGGKTTWSNLATCCKPCNGEKADRRPEEFRPLLAVPYQPSPAEHLILSAPGRRILADQMSWLESFASKARKLN